MNTRTALCVSASVVQTAKESKVAILFSWVFAEKIVEVVLGQFRLKKIKISALC
jgi:hypothetical protein